MTSLGVYGRVLGAGVADALAVPQALRFLVKSRKIRAIAAKCVLLNGCLFLGSIGIMEFVVRPTTALLLRRWDRDGEIVYVADTLFAACHYVLWLYPLYCISFVLNMIWYQEIADEAFLLQYGPPKTPVTYKKFVRRLANVVYRLLLFASFLVQILMASLVPYVGLSLSVFLLSCLYALYSFDYTWANQGWGADREMQSIEQRWLYYVGYGLPCALASSFFPTFVNSGIFALLFPLFILTAVRARPSECDHESIWPREIPLFRVSKWMNLLLLRRLDA